MKQTDKNTNLHVIEGIIAIALLGLIAWFFTNGRPASAPSNYEPNNTSEVQQPATNTTPTNNGTATNTPSGTDTIVVSTQSAGVKVVTIDNLVLSKPAFVAITTTSDKSAGIMATNIIGSSKYLSVGTKQDLEVTLTQALKANTNYYAVIYQDDGDKKFSAKLDTLLSGKNSSTTFTAK